MKRCTPLLTLTAIVYAVASAGLPAIASAKPCGSGFLGMGPPPGGGPQLEQLVEGLDLDEETLASVYEIMDSSRERHRELRRQIRDAHEQMRSLLEQEEPNEDAVLEQVDVIGALRTEAHKEGLRTLLKVRALLTPAQREQLLEQMRSRFEQGPGGYGPRGGSRPRRW
jgi:Spy/CpxP family protein refolding chaperone